MLVLLVPKSSWAIDIKLSYSLFDRDFKITSGGQIDLKSKPFLLIEELEDNREQIPQVFDRNNLDNLKCNEESIESKKCAELYKKIKDLIY